MAEAESGSAVVVDADLLRRLQSRVQAAGPSVSQRLALPELKRKKGRPLPRVSALQAKEQRSEASQHSGVRYFLDAVAAGRTVADILPVPAHRGPLNLERSFDEHATDEDRKAIERIFQQRVEEQRRSRQLVQQLNERPDEVNDDADQQRPDSPGKEYDLQYMQYAIKGPRFSASVHEKLLQGLNAQDQQKFLSSAKDVEEALRREHARQTEDATAVGGASRPKRRRVPQAPRSRKTIQKPKKA